MRNQGNEYVEVDNLVLIVEGPKSFGVVPEYMILQDLDPRGVQHYTEIKQRLGDMLIWLPKSQMSEYDVYDGDVFPNLEIAFKLKERPDKSPYKSILKCKLKGWLVGKKKLVENLDQI